MSDIAEVTTATVVRHGGLKTLVESYTGLDKDALHIHVALLVYLMAMFVFRQNRRSRFPWLVVLVLELLNESLDLRRNYVDLGRPRDLEMLGWHESLKDLWNTMLWPTVLLLIGRYTRLFAPKPRPARTDQPQGKLSAPSDIPS